MNPINSFGQVLHRSELGSLLAIDFSNYISEIHCYEYLNCVPSLSPNI